MSNEIKALAATQRGDLHSIHATANWLRDRLAGEAARCCRILGIDATTDSVARDICEEIVLYGTSVDEVIAKLQRHLEGGQ
jgi:hypothetical protein